MKQKTSRPWSSFIGIAIIVIAYVASLFNVFSTGSEQIWTNKKVIRICHWQLESGFRESFNWVIAEYEKLHPDVKIVQLAIAGPAYKQFLVTQLIGGTAPDIVEIGQLGDNTEISKVARYFYGLSSYVAQPNPYNNDNDLKGVPWVHTFKHELEWNWDASNLDYYSIGITGVTRRIVYNKTLIKKITGSETPPANFREFIAFCKRVKKYSDSTGQQVYPIASARYQYEDVANGLSGSFSRPYGYDVYDRNNDASAGPPETFMAWLEGRYTFTDDRTRAGNEISRLILPYLEPGFMAKDRQDASFSFAQQKSVMIYVGAWDMNSMVVQADESGFKVGAMRIPIPDQSDPEYGKFVMGQGADSKDFNMPFGVCRFSKHPDVAIDFLRFYSSQKIAEGFCKRCGWMCEIRGSENIDFIRGFEPNYLGFSMSQTGLSMGEQTNNLIAQSKWDFNTGKISFDEYIKEYRQKFLPIAMKDISSNLEYSKNGLPSSAQMLSDLSLRLKFTTDQAQRNKLMMRLTNAAESYSSFWSTVQGTVYQFLEVMKNDNERTRELKQELQYKMFLDEFVNTPESTKDSK